MKSSFKVNDSYSPSYAGDGPDSFNFVNVNKSFDIQASNRRRPMKGAPTKIQTFADHFLGNLEKPMRMKGNKLKRHQTRFGGGEIISQFDSHHVREAGSSYNAGIDHHGDDSVIIGHARQPIEMKKKQSFYLSKKIKKSPFELVLPDIHQSISSAQNPQNRAQQSFISPARLYLRKGDRNKTFAMNMIKNAQKVYDYDQQQQEVEVLFPAKDRNEMGSRWKSLNQQPQPVPSTNPASSIVSMSQQLRSIAQRDATADTYQRKKLKLNSLGGDILPMTTTKDDNTTKSSAQHITNSLPESVLKKKISLPIQQASVNGGDQAEPPRDRSEIRTRNSQVNLDLTEVSNKDPSHNEQVTAHQRFKTRISNVFRTNKTGLIQGQQEDFKQRHLGLQSLDSAIEYLNTVSRHDSRRKHFRHNTTQPMTGRSHNSEGPTQSRSIDIEDYRGLSKVQQLQQLELSDTSIRSNLITYLKDENLDLAKNFAFTRKTLTDFISQYYGIKLSRYLVTEAIVACRGKDMENSDPIKQFSLPKLIGWMQANLPSLSQLDHVKQTQMKEREYLKKIDNYRDELLQQGLAHHEIIAKLSEKFLEKNQSQLTNVEAEVESRGEDSEHKSQPELKHVGKSMFIIKDDDDHRGVKTNNMKLVQAIKDRIQQFLVEAEKKPSLRKKIMKQLQELEDQLNEIRAEEGYLAQLRAQQRLRDSKKAEQEKNEKDIENILERTAVLDSAVRAVSLQKMLVPSWNEQKNSYVIMSKLNDKDNAKLNKMLFNRYDDH